MLQYKEKRFNFSFVCIQQAPKLLDQFEQFLSPLKRLVFQELRRVEFCPDIPTGFWVLLTSKSFQLIADESEGKWCIRTLNGLYTNAQLTKLSESDQYLHLIFNLTVK